ncbi:thiopurine S-methyltransferase [uncultured Microbulbifer sp.]|uniref:thiopurine S-methyltransferase n=1 Tax=uncultured Microbulbifer sp. TaxID=348147 RepID=UPI0025DB35B9|nr:thiopurine S-methyltransferase [uncultured Microbulbifer sp.]
MEKAFWLEKWQKNEIGFHNTKAHPLLVRYFDHLCLNTGSRLFLPLCGKTLDIAWLLSRGFRVAGAELSELAVVQLFEALGVKPEILPQGELTRYSSDGIDIFVGDIFQLQPEALGPIDAIYDRAALVALPEDMRRQYSAHLQALTAIAPQLLITFDYDQAVMPGPPFCVSDDEVTQHYGSEYRLTLTEAVDVPGGLKGKVSALEKVWILQPEIAE